MCVKNLAAKLLQLCQILKNYTKQTLWVITLIAIIIVLLIAAGIQSRWLDQATSQFNYNLALLAANDMANRIQINHNEYIKGQASFYAEPRDPQEKIIIDQHINLYCSQDSSGCQSYTLAANDLISWRQALRENLHHGNGIIIFSPTHSSYIIKITWQDHEQSPQRSLALPVLTVNQPWQHICKLNQKLLLPEDSTAKYQRAQIIYDNIMGNKHNYNNFNFTAKIFTDYINNLNNFNIKLANHLCDISCTEYYSLNVIDHNICDCKQLINQRAINFNCDNNYATTK